MAILTKQPNKIAELKLRWPFDVLQTVGTVGLVGLVFLLLTQSPFVVIGLLAAVGAFIVVSRWPHLGLYLLVLSVPGQTETSFALGSSRVTLTQAAVLLALAGWVGSRVLYRRPFLAQPLPRLLPFYLLYLATMVVSLTIARSTSEGLNELSRWLITFFAYVLATSVIHTRRELWGLIICLSTGAVIEAGIGVVQTRLNLGPESYAISDGLSRAFGTFDKPNSFAGYLEMGLPLLVALTLLAWKSRNAAMRNWFALQGRPRSAANQAVRRTHLWLLLLVPAVGLVGLGVIASYSRGAWLGLIVGAVAMILIRGRKSLPIIIIGGSVLILVGLGVQTGAIQTSSFGRLASIADQFSPFDVRDVTVTDENFAVVERMAMWQAGGNMFLSNPWLGVGIGNYNVRYNEFSTPQWPDSRGHAHNYYIHAAAETGLIGAVAYLLLLGIALSQAAQAARITPDAKLRYVCWGVWGIIVAVATHNLVEDLHVLNMGVQWSSLLAVLYLVGQQTSNKQSQMITEAEPN